MRNLLYLIITLGVFGSCKKKTELEYTDRLLDIRFSVESDCDTTYIDSLRYLNSELNWVTVVKPDLPWTVDRTYYDLDTTALEVFGFVGNCRQGPVLNTMRIGIGGWYNVNTPRHGSSSEGVGDNVWVKPLLDTLSFRRLVSIKVEED